MTVRPLPHSPPPLIDELLSSWIVRLAHANHCAGAELCKYLGMREGRVPETPSDIADVDTDRMCAALRLPQEDLTGMLLKHSISSPIPCISNDNFQCCLQCTARTSGLALRHWRFAWSMTCEICGGLLTPVHPASDHPKNISKKLQARAAKGAQVLKQACENGSHRDRWRIKMALQIAGVLYSDLSPTTLTSSSQYHRFTLLAAIGMSVSRPLLYVALVLRDDARAVDRLHRAFPYCRRVLRAVVKVSVSLNDRLPKAEPRYDRRSRTFPAQPISRVSQRHVMAMRQAIEHLGKDAPHHRLMDYAASLLNRSE